MQSSVLMARKGQKGRCPGRTGKEPQSLEDLPVTQSRCCRNPFPNIEQDPCCIGRALDLIHRCQ